ncbi:MAG: nucleotidyltransferase domain-containing protein [Ignavibacteria bacterium]|jgi:predicted nucleotidyltransferase|nr:nucleotidyltransferase domain-containing protein [Ignavibacteria bacterium]MCU7498370.1 nucleotidyltransferase domain-containing protein [Ignavibacteria bacterium]MCU7512885.1 nucleotidyltransferase domain-containing protein [Ignavibacteria bacterium]MCU7520264.1 nucleotidyltransferase domain-containing protein [Ignavibacteria bacterium]MCU7526286.1 nucleotidyltransferase domain-containing protein [Ignavibacteria bacterium]
MRQQLNNKLRFARYTSVKKAILYGSRAKGNFKNGSDIDLTLEGDELELDTLLKILNELDELDLPYKIDLSIYSAISNNDLLEHINRVGITFYLQKI